MSDGTDSDFDMSEYDRLEQQAEVTQDETDVPETSDTTVDPAAADEADQLDQTLSAGADEDEYPNR